MTESQIDVHMSHAENFEKALNRDSIPFEKANKKPSTLTSEIYEVTFTILGDAENVEAAKAILLDLETREYSIRVTRKKMNIVNDLALKYNVDVVEVSPVKLFGSTLYYKMLLKGRDVDLGGIALYLHYS